MIQAAGEQKNFFAFWPVVLTPSPCRTCHYHHNARFTFSDRHVRFNEPAHPSGHYLSGHSKRRCWDFYEGTVTTGHIGVGGSRAGSLCCWSSPVKHDLSITVNNCLLSPQLRGRDPASRGDRYMLVNFEDVPFGIKVEFVFGSCPALHCPSIAPPRCDHYINCVEKIFRRSFRTPFKTWPTFCFSVSSKELWVLFIQRGDICGEGGREGGEGGWWGARLAYFTCLDQIVTLVSAHVETV